MRAFQVVLGSGPIVLASVTGPAPGQKWKPQKNFDLVVSAGAGGAADRPARLLQRLLQTVPGMPGQG